MVPLPRPIELVLVDFDDTLVDTAPRFQNARRALVALMQEAGFAEDVAYRVLYHEIDPDMRRQYGLGPRRMEPAFVATYERLCTVHGLVPNQDLSARAAELGRACYGSPTAFDGALHALQRLVAVHPTVIYTQSGEIEYQLSCIRGAGIVDIVNEDRVRVCERKDAVAFRDTLMWYGVADPAAAWMIGNSMRSDINPALEAGANAILVESSDPWEYDMVEPHGPHFHRAPSFPHAVDLLVR
jgi:putative hydrolase of the HAD superfamily